MRKQLIENAAYDVATQVRTVEDCIESALAEIAELQGKMIRARSLTGVGFMNSHSAFEQLAAATNGLFSARGGIAQCHAALVETKQQIPGLRTVSWGDGQECPPKEGFTPLRVVA